MDAFYRLAAKDYRHLAESIRWTEVIATLRKQFDDRLSVLDVACGSGQFPSALQQYGGWGPADLAVQDLSIPYALLDPSQFSIDTAREKLRPPFEAAEELLCTAQQLNQPDRRYPIVWATHALYCVPSTEIDIALARMIEATDIKGLGFIAHASESAHYLKFHQEYLRSKYSSGSLPYCSAEEVMAGLRSHLSDDELFFHPIEYDGTVHLSDTETAERYLQRCLFDDDLTLDQMMSDEHLGSYLDRCVDKQQGVWRFRQRTWLMFYGKHAPKAAKWIVESVSG